MGESMLYVNFRADRFRSYERVEWSEERREERRSEEERGCEMSCEGAYLEAARAVLPAYVFTRGSVCGVVVVALLGWSE